MYPRKSAVESRCVLIMRVSPMRWIRFAWTRKQKPSSESRHEHVPPVSSSGYIPSSDPPSVEGYTVQELTQDQLDAELEPKSQLRR